MRRFLRVFHYLGLHACVHDYTEGVLSIPNEGPSKQQVLNVTQLHFLIYRWALDIAIPILQVLIGAVTLDFACKLFYLVLVEHFTKGLLLLKVSLTV